MVVPLSNFERKWEIKVKLDRDRTELFTKPVFNCHNVSD